MQKESRFDYTICFYEILEQTKQIFMVGVTWGGRWEQRRQK